ncbi:MAG: hypothetical protein R2856_23440 [Caldilineaceae bacterium]
MATLIGERLAAAAFTARRMLSWARPVCNDALSLYQHDLLGDDLFGGRGGDALFLAALAHVSGASALARHGVCGAVS